MPELRPLSDRGFLQQVFADRIRELAEQRGKIEILEAGCGRRWNIALDGVDYRLTGIDTDEEALRARRDEVGDLDEWIVGDLRTVPLQPASYDLVYCAFVLEHVSGAREVLDRMVDALRPGGLMIIRVPDRDSVWGFVTRVTPFWLHVRYRRWIAGDKEAGKPGHAPYPTAYDRVVSYAGMQAYCAERGLEIVDAYSSNLYLHDLGRKRILVGTAMRTIGALSLGRLASGHINLNFVIRKPASA